MAFSTKFKWENRWSNRKDPFNGDYITSFDRVPNIGEHVCFDGVNKYKIVDVITELRGWDDFYTIILE